MNNSVLAATARFLVGFGILTSWDASAFLRAQEPTSGNEELRLLVIQGEGFVNNVKKRVARDPVVEVRDRNNKPVAGAVVTFLLPNSGASGTFANGSQILTVTTNDAGRAMGLGLKPNAVSGAFKVNVTASYQGQTATTAINQTNGAAAGLGTLATLGIFGAAAGVAIGIAKALGGGGKSTKISLGPPTVQ